MNSLPRILVVVVAVALAIGLSACASSSKGRPAGEPARPASQEVDARELPVFDGMTGARLDWPALVARASGADVVLIGEVHGHELGGAATVALFEDVLARTSSCALSMEFFERDEQVVLDDYLTGITDEKTFRDRSGRTDGNYPPAHAAVVNAASVGGRPVIASNAPRRYVTVARKEGFDRLRGLTPDQRQLFVIPDALTEGKYKEAFYELMSGMVASHAPAPDHTAPREGDDSAAQASQANLDAAANEMILGYYRAQNLWDATMADSIAVGASRGNAPVVHVVGQFHIDDDGGLALRVRERMPGAKVVTVSLVDATDMEPKDRGCADIVVCIGAR